MPLLLTQSRPAFAVVRACFTARDACKLALKIDAEHAKTSSRLARAEAAIKAYEGARARYEGSFAEFQKAAKAGNFLGAVRHAEDAVETSIKLDPHREVSALLALSEAISLVELEDGGRKRDWPRAAGAAHRALEMCQKFEKRSYEIDFSEDDEVVAVSTKREPQ